MAHAAQGLGRGQQQPYSAQDQLASHRGHAQDDDFAGSEAERFSRPEGHFEFGQSPTINFPKNPLSKFLANFLQNTVHLGVGIVYQLYTNSSVIVLGAGLAGGVHYFASQHNPLASAALDASFHGSVAVAKYVFLAFSIKTALSPIHEAFIEKQDAHDVFTNRADDMTDRADDMTDRADDMADRAEEMSYRRPIARKELINSHVVSYLTPIALAWVVAYSQGIPVKLAAATLYTVGTFALMKVLDKGYDYALAAYAAYEKKQNSGKTVL